MADRGRARGRSRGRGRTNDPGPPRPGSGISGAAPRPPQSGNGRDQIQQQMAAVNLNSQSGAPVMQQQPSTAASSGPARPAWGNTGTQQPPPSASSGPARSAWGNTGTQQASQQPSGDDMTAASGGARAKSRGGQPPRNADDRGARPKTRDGQPPGNGSDGRVGQPPSNGNENRTGPSSRNGNDRPVRPPRRDDALVVSRPDDLQKRGTTGTPVTLLANYFLLNATGGRAVIYQYHVNFKPPVESKAVRVAMVKQQHDIIGNVSAFDGMCLFLPQKLPDENTVFTTVSNFDNQPVEVTIKFAAELSATNPECIRMLNVIFNRVLALMGMQRVGQDFYRPNAAINIPHLHLDIWPGIAARIGQYEQHTLVSCDLNHRLLRTQTVLDFMMDIYNNRRYRNSFKQQCIKEIVGQIVLTRYNNKTYRVDDINWEMNPQSTFETKRGKRTFMDYYAKSYELAIKDTEQPLLMSKPKKRDRRAGMEGDILLVPELCYLTGITDEMRKDFRVMQDIHVHTRVNPTNRRENLENFGREVMRHDSARAELANWGVAFSEKLINVQARVLAPVQIQMKNRAFTYQAESAEWSKESRGEKMLAAQPISEWTILYPRECSEVVNGFTRTMARVCGPLGIQLGEPTLCQLARSDANSWVRSLKEEIRPQLRIVVCIVPNDRKDIYDCIKTTCCVQHPINSQVIVRRTLSRQDKLMSVCTKIAIQMNCKLSGEAWTVPIPLQAVMFCGMDTYHRRGARSVGAFVASMNANHTRFYSRAVFFNEYQELHDQLNTMMRFALHRYREINGRLPEKIFLYRDGVGDGQLDAVYKHELSQVHEAIRYFDEPGAPPYRPALAVVVVKKRIATRFLLPRGQGGNCQNPPPGTVVDDVVTNANWYDFFIVSQSVRQGTVSPTHYNVIFNTMPPSLTPDRMQQITYRMTHLYSNWQGTIRVPAPCMYAHKMAYLVGDNLKTEPSPALYDSLFYL